MQYNKNGSFLPRPLLSIQVYQSQDIPSILKDIERQSAEEELYAVGFLAYEAASAFDNAFPSPRPSSPAFPLLYFAMYSKAEEFSESIFSGGGKV